MAYIDLYKNGTEIAVEAMFKAYKDVGISASPIRSAVLAAAPMIGARFGGGPVKRPLAHVVAGGVIAMNDLLANGRDHGAICDPIHEAKTTQWIDPEVASLATSTVASPSLMR